VPLSPAVYPLREHVAKILRRPSRLGARARRAVLLSLAGGDFVFDSGQDLSIGYDSHDGEEVHLYLEESFSFHVATPEAAVALKSSMERLEYTFRGFPWNGPSRSARP